MQAFWKTLLRISFVSVFLAAVGSNAAIANSSAANDSVNFLVFSDIHLDTTQTHPMEIEPKGVNWGSGLDVNTFNVMLSQIQDKIQHGLIPQPMFILITGDIAGYARPITHPDATYNNEEIVLKGVYNAFPNTPILLAFGNNDSLEKDYGLFYYAPGIKGKHSSYEIAMVPGNGWRDGFLSTGRWCQITNMSYPCLINEDKENGYFTAYLAPNLQLISLNSVMFSDSRHNTTPQSLADKQLVWLGNQLKIADFLNDSVLIASHIPFGNNIFDNSTFWRSNDQDQFYTYLSRYRNNIIGVLSGHTHLEELKVLQDTAHNNIGALIFTAGLSTSHGNAPSLKSFSLSKNSSTNKWAISNYETFSFQNNSTNAFSFHLDKLYDFDSYYCASGQSVQSIFDCLGYVTAAKLYTYYTAGNHNFNGTVSAPQDIFVTLPNVPNNNTVQSGGGGNSFGIYGVLGAVAAAGIGVAVVNTVTQDKSE
ncbi:MAG: metallophosphoesterase [Gammaproteobacteria bacterium]|nr:metallophosphoesterase [Gammaproteobacteria bacterium]